MLDKYSDPRVLNIPTELGFQYHHYITLPLIFFCFVSREDQVLLGQGTLRPDLIESASSMCSNNAATIKTHHNDTELVRVLRQRGRVVEPLKDFHKDEVSLRPTVHITIKTHHNDTELVRVLQQRFITC